MRSESPIKERGINFCLTAWSPQGQPRLRPMSSPLKSCRWINGCQSLRVFAKIWSFTRHIRCLMPTLTWKGWANGNGKIFFPFVPLYLNGYLYSYLLLLLLLLFLLLFMLLLLLLMLLRMLILLMLLLLLLPLLLMLLLLSLLVTLYIMALLLVLLRLILLQSLQSHCISLPLTKTDALE